MVVYCEVEKCQWCYDGLCHKDSVNIVQIAETAECEDCEEAWDENEW